jgi:hypothetical protein
MTKVKGRVLLSGPVVTGPWDQGFLACRLDSRILCLALLHALSALRSDASLDEP